MTPTTPVIRLWKLIVQQSEEDYIMNTEAVAKALNITEGKVLEFWEAKD